MKNLIWLIKKFDKSRIYRKSANVRRRMQQNNKLSCDIDVEFIESFLYLNEIKNRNTKQLIMQYKRLLKYDYVFFYNEIHSINHLVYQ